MSEIKKVNDIKELMRGYISAAAINLALETGLFWELDDEMKTIEEIAESYSIPFHRCSSWLKLLSKFGLLEQNDNQYTSSEIAKNTIINIYSKETWGLLAQEAREQYGAIIDLNDHIIHPKSVWTSQGIENLNYVTKMQQNSEKAELFTRMLHEIHKPLADEIADLLDLTKVSKLMDIGGGSGVISFAMLRNNLDLTATVFDIENVCKAGRKIAEEKGLIHRIKYEGGNFVEDDLPSGYDIVLECDVGIYNVELFAKVLKSLNTGGKFVIISNTDEQGAWLHEPDKLPSLMSQSYSFLSSLDTDKSKVQTSEDLKIMLSEVGFVEISVIHLTGGMILIESLKTTKN